MPRNTTVIPKASSAKILMKAGAKRVSAGAAEILTDVLTDMACEISTQAAKIAKHSGRKTIHEGDIKIAAKK